jgi:hypothetical protein
MHSVVDTPPSVSTSESKTKLLRILAKDVNAMKKDLEDQKQKTEGVAEWIKNTFRPGMEKMKEMIDQEVKQLKDKLDQNEKLSKYLTQWIKDNLGTKLEKIEEMVTKMVIEKFEKGEQDVKAREESLWKLFNVKFNALVEQFEEYQKKVQEEKKEYELRVRVLQEEVNKMQQERLKIEQARLAMSELYDKLQLEAKQRPEETVSLLRNLAKKVDAERKKLDDERQRLQQDIKTFSDEVAKEMKRLEEKRSLDQERVTVDAERLRIRLEKEKLQIEEEWKKVNAEKKKLGLEITPSPFSQQKENQASIPTPPPSRQQPSSNISSLFNESKEKKSTQRTSQEEVTMWLKQNGFEMYRDVFMKNGYDSLSVVAALDSNDLDIMEITLPGHRKGLLNAASKLKRQE